MYFISFFGNKFRLSLFIMVHALYAIIRSNYSRMVFLFLVVIMAFGTVRTGHTNAGKQRTFEIQSLSNSTLAATSEFIFKSHSIPKWNLLDLYLELRVIDVHSQVVHMLKEHFIILISRNVFYVFISLNAP
jgi:hypothetical protein